MGFFSSLGKIAGIAGAVTGQGWLTALGGAASAIGNNQIKQNQWSQAYDLAYNQLYNQHQIEVADLKKAGLNPILSANNGNTTFGVSGTSNLENAGESAASAKQASAQAQNLDKQNELLEMNKNKLVADIQKTQADTRNVEQDTAYKRALTNYTTGKTSLIPLERQNIRAQTELAKAQTPYWRMQVKVAEANVTKILQDIINSKRITDAQVNELGTRSDANVAAAEASRAAAGASSAAAAKFFAEAGNIEQLTPYQIEELSNRAAQELAQAGNLDADTQKILEESLRVSLINDRMSTGQDWAKFMSYAGEALRELNPFNAR